MKIKQTAFDELVNSTGAPALNFSTRPAICAALAKWFFVRQEPESEVTKTVREYLLELDDNGYVKWEQD